MCEKKERARGGQVLRNGINKIQNKDEEEDIIVQKSHMFLTWEYSKKNYKSRLIKDIKVLQDNTIRL